MIPDRLISVNAFLQERKPAQDAKCRYAGCKPATVLYKSPKTATQKAELWPLCEKHAIYWGEWQAQRSGESDHAMRR